MSHRILFVIESLFSLGAAQQLEALAQALANRQYEIQVAVLGNQTTEPTRWTDAGIKINFLNGDDRTGLHPVRDGLPIIHRLRKLIQTFSPEIVHAWCGPAELVTLIATQPFPLGKRLNRFRLISTELYLSSEKQLVRRSAENWMAKRIETLVVPHAAVRNHLTENGYHASRIEIVPNAVFLPDPPINPAQSKRKLLQDLNLPESTILAGTVASLVHRTRLKDLIWAADLLTCIRPDLHFIVIGNGSQLKRLKRFASLTEAQSHIHFLGQPEFPEPIVASLDVYWHSHLRAPLSGNLLAAMAHRVPVISVLGPGTEDLIRHQETGFAVNFGARDEFARWTKYLIERSDSAEKLAQQGESFAQSNFKASKMVDGYLAIYDRG